MGKANKKPARKDRFEIKHTNKPVEITELGQSVRRVFFLSKILDWGFQDLLHTGREYQVISKARIGEIRNLTTAFKNNLLTELQALPNGDSLVRLVQVDLDAEKIKDLSYILELCNKIGITGEIITDLERAVKLIEKTEQDGREISETV